MKIFSRNRCVLLSLLLLLGTALVGCGGGSDTGFVASDRLLSTGVTSGVFGNGDLDSGNVGPGTGTPINFGGTTDATPTILPFQSFLYLPDRDSVDDNTFLVLGINDQGLATNLIPQVIANLNVTSILMRSDRKVLYSLGSDTIAAFSLEDGNGTPTRLGADVPTGTADFSTNMVITPSVTGFAYVANENPLLDGTVTGFRIEADGQLTALGGPQFPVAIPADNDRFRVVLNPAGDQLYVPISENGSVQRYRIEADGSLTLLDTVLSGSARIWDLEFMPNLPFAYGSNIESTSLSIFSVAPDGALTFIQNFPLVFGPTVTGSIRPFDLAAHPTLPVLYGENSTTLGGQDDTLSVFDVDVNTGDLTLLEIERPGRGMSSLFFDPLGVFLYTTADTDDLVSYSINADGTLEVLERFDLVPGSTTVVAGDGREGATATNTLFRALDPNS